MHIIHSQPSALLDSRPSSSHIMVVPPTPTLLPYQCSCTADFEQVPYMVSVHHRDMSCWSRTWHQEPFCSSYLRKHHFRSLSPWLHMCLLVSYLVPWWPSWIIKIDPIPKIALFISAPYQYDLNRDFVCLFGPIVQENIISDRTYDRFRLEVHTPIGNVVLNIGIWESSFSFPSIRSSCWTKKTE
jgi:hypothetical protein